MFILESEKSLENYVRVPTLHKQKSFHLIECRTLPFSDTLRAQEIESKASSSKPNIENRYQHLELKDGTDPQFSKRQTTVRQRKSRVWEEEKNIP